MRIGVTDLGFSCEGVPTTRFCEAALLTLRGQVGAHELFELICKSDIVALGGALGGRALFFCTHGSQHQCVEEQREDARQKDADLKEKERATENEEPERAEG
jgi:hypothetical protein